MTPTPPLALASMATVYFGTSIPFLQQHGWRQIDIRGEEVAPRTPFRNPKVIGGILEHECDALFEAAQRNDLKAKVSRPLIRKKSSACF
ncbi:MAG: hypothetical protein ABI618_16140 [Nitrospirota bacterium]